MGIGSNAMDVCEQIRAERRCGITRCAVVDGRLSLLEAARLFALADDPGIYRDIERAEADRIAVRILQADLAYGLPIIGADRADHLWAEFVALFEGQDAKLATNAGADSYSWTPATESTFDLGVLVIGTSKAGCLWVQDED
jgi:hypothetical protein